MSCRLLRGQAGKFEEDNSGKARVYNKHRRMLYGNGIFLVALKVFLLIGAYNIIITSHKVLERPWRTNMISTCKSPHQFVPCSQYDEYGIALSPRLCHCCNANLGKSKL